MIERASIDKVIETARIEEVVGDFVDLKKRGTSLVAKCPFHDEKTPSFHVHVAKGIFKCFSCGRGGDALKFVMEHEKYSYPEAIRYLAQKYNIELEETRSNTEVIEAQKQRESLYIVSQYATQFFKTQLWESDEGKSVGLSYFKDRGFNDTTIKKFELGYSPETWDALHQNAIENGFKEEYLIETGLSIKNDRGRVYDRFRARVLFPIHNFTGRIVGFGGRTLKSDKSIPKYVNSPESDIYHKSNILYGLFQAKKEIRQHNNCYLVEGYADVLSVHQAGIENVVASSGTSLTTEQINLIQRFSENITLLYDGDMAGIKAALRGMDMCLAQNLNVKIVLFPDNHDPDSYIRLIGSHAFKNYIESEPKDFIHFKTEILLKDAGNDPIKKAQVINEILQSIALIPDQIKRANYNKTCSELLDTDERTLAHEVEKIVQKNTTQKIIRPRPAQENAANTEEETLQENTENPTVIPSQFIKEELQEIEICRLLLTYGKENIPVGEEQFTVAEVIIDSLTDIIFEDKRCAVIYEAYRNGVDNEQIPEARDFYRHDDAQIVNLVISCISTPYILSENWVHKANIWVTKEEDILENAVKSAILHLQRHKVAKQMQQKLKEIKTCKNLEEEAILLHEYQKLKKIEKHLSNELSIVINGY